MSSEIAINIEGISKCYQIYNNSRDRLFQMLSRGKRQYFHEFWALNGINFEVKKGETVGIIGRNGSGKSTLLQIICGTLNPTHGNVKTQGRIAALLELGSGFNPEFTGRENVYMNGAILGLSKQEIDARYDDIVSFADIGEFIDQPIKKYSSGMMVRLAFSVAINVSPDILVVDEALSVGDELFQRKCFARIEAIREQGATILFVSHSGSQIVELCDKAILIDSGECLTIGSPKHVVAQYQKLLYAPPHKRNAIRTLIKNGFTNNHAIAADRTNEGIHHPLQDSLESTETFDPNLKPSSTIEYESHGAYISNPIILSLEGHRVNGLIRGKTYKYIYTVDFSESARNIRFGMMIKTISGVELGGASTADFSKNGLPYAEKGSTYQVSFSFRCALNPGVYFFNAGVLGEKDDAETYLHRLTDIAMFKVLPIAGSISTGLVDFDCSPSIESTAEASGVELRPSI